MNYRPTTLMRRLGNLEQIFWLKDQQMPYHFAVCAQIAGPTTVPAWRAALDMVQSRHPNFSVKIELDEAGNPCFHHVAGARIPLRVVESGELRWEPEMERELATAFDPQQSPLIRAVLLHQPHRAALIISAHHSIADTKSLVFTIRDALQALSGKLLDPLPPTGSLDDLLAPVAGPAVDEMSDEEVAPAAGEGRDVFRTPDGSFPRVSSLKLTAALTSALRQRSRKEETTVHGALVAATVAAARRISSELREATITVCSAVDARKMIGAGEEVALFSGGGTISLEPQTMTFWETARLAKRDIAPSQTLESMSNGMRSIAKALAKRPNPTEAGALMAGFKFEINISNLGNLPIETRFGDLTFESLWGPSILAGFEVEQEIGAGTINGSLHLLHTSYKPLPSLLESVEQLLAAACS